MNRPVRGFSILLVASSMIFCAGLRAESPAPVGTVETLPADGPYGAATAIRNIAYVERATPHQTFDLYLPKDQGSTPLPFVVWMHGGAWELSSKEWDNVKYLVKNGYAIATVDYRLAPEAKFPTQIQDCNAALNYVVAHAGEYGLDPKRFFIGGASAGGHLSLLLGLARHEQAFGADPALKPLAILDFFGPADLTTSLGDLEAAHSEEGIKLISRVVPQMLGASPEENPEKAKAASPINYIRPDSAPVLIFQGTKDPLVPVAQSERLHAKLDEAKVRNQLVLVTDAPHDGPLFETPEQQAKVLAFLHSVML